MISLGESMTDSKTSQLIPVLKGQEALQWVAAIAEGAEEETSLAIESAVREIISLIRVDGDEGLQQLASRFKDPPPRTVTLTVVLENALAERLAHETKVILIEAANRIRRFAEAVVAVAKPVTVDCGEYAAGFNFSPVGRVACYIPAGRYPLPSTALMTAVTARAAGVKDICIFSPSLRDEILFAGSLAGVTEFHEVGGAQAVAAAAYGTATIKPVDMIVGPGNAYVTEAKRQVYGKVGIDMLAGPSEVAIIADANSNPEWLALDLLSQAEHDPNSRAYLLTDDAAIADAVARVIAEKLSSMNLPDYIDIALSSSAIVLLDSLDRCIDAANDIAPEHLQLQIADPLAVKERLKNYGALFMGYYSTVPYGDYMAGPNHTLPTNRAARFSGGLNPFTFLRGQSWVHVGAAAVELPRLTAAFANLEGLVAHAAAASVRIPPGDSK